MYLLLPLETLNTSSPKPRQINWIGINSCISAVEIMKKSSLLGAEHCNGETGNLSPYRNGSCSTNVIHFAYSMADTNNLKDMVVLAIHTGKIYSVVEVVNNTSAESPFDGNTDNASSKYMTFSEYFNQNSIDNACLDQVWDNTDVSRIAFAAGYIRDSAFDPRRWVAPGQRSIRPVPCKCGVDTPEVPLDAKFHTEDPKVLIGNSCDKGHRWMSSKTIADCVEALIGAYYVGGGIIAALHLMKWLGIDAELDPVLVVEAITTAFYEAITHASQQELGVGYCYQRLEYLGDSVLDLLITWHLYQSYTDIDPSELTDLRSASVNNENFAQAAVRQNLHRIFNTAQEYVKSISESHTDGSLQLPKGPKALVDMVESIAGAILLDTKLNLNEVWRIYKPLLSPIVTPDKLELHPFRKLNELCASRGYFIKENFIKKGDMVHAELSLQLKDVLFIGEGYEGGKIARGEAACRLLKELEVCKMSFSMNLSIIVSYQQLGKDTRPAATINNWLEKLARSSSHGFVICGQVFNYCFSITKVNPSFNDSLLTRFFLLPRSSISLYFSLGVRGENIKKWKSCGRKGMSSAKNH
ncbi:endoribonuclease dicer like protein 3 [Quercus suber]|uniref:Endoribonuclease dicer like protein 3 n=1 Tax=Quercus suber TaxID=58331 RepID=A0AAW0LTM6_QUESU